MSRVNALLASFKQGQKKALVLQSEARQEREDKLAKAAAGAAPGAPDRLRRRSPQVSLLALPLTPDWQHPGTCRSWSGCQGRRRARSGRQDFLGCVW
jgi:hypothetical protein